MNEYPFSKVAGSIQNAWFVDASLVIGPAATWSYTENVVRLYSIVGTPTTLTVTLRSVTTDGNLDFVFVFSSSDPAYTTKYADCSLGAAYGFGCLVAGDLTGAFTTFSETPADMQLIPQNIQNNSELFVTGINVANHYQELYEDTECNASQNPSGSGYKVETIVPLIGDVDILPGKFIIASTAAASGSIILGPAQSLESSGIPDCTPIRVVPVGYNESLEPKCSEMLYTFNGITPNEQGHGFLFLGSPGFEIATTNSHTITMTIRPLVLFNPASDVTNCSQ